MIARQAARVQGPVRKRRFDRAAGLRIVLTICEFAAQRPLLNIVKHLTEDFFHIGHAQFAHAGHIDDQSAAGQTVQGAVAGGVPALFVPFADALRGGHVAARQGVEQSGLADARRTEQRNRCPRVDPAPHAIKRRGVFGVDRLHRQIALHRRGAADKFPGIVDQIGFGQHQHREGAGLAAQGEITLQSRLVEFLVAGRHDKHRVHVGGDGLDGIALAGRRALKQAFALQNAIDAVAAGVEHDPVADRGAGFGVAALQYRSQAHAALAVRTDYRDQRALHRGDAGEAVALQFLQRELLQEEAVQAEIPQALTFSDMHYPRVHREITSRGVFEFPRWTSEARVPSTQ